MSTSGKAKVLLTGGSGFFGSVVLKSLSLDGHHVTTLGRSETNTIHCDLSTTIPTFTERFDIVIHNAGKAHTVPRTALQRKAFFESNCQGTTNLLRGLQQSGFLPGAVVFVSSVSVYGLIGGKEIQESHPLSATDAYGLSKIGAEQIVQDWAQAHSLKAGIVRLPLIAAKNPPGNLRSMIRGIKKGYYFKIAGSTARKSVVLAEDVAAILPVVAQKGGVFNLTDGYHPSFGEIEERIVRQLGCEAPKNISYRTAYVLGLLGDVLEFILPGKAPVTTEKVKKIVSDLTFDDSRARQELGWKPRRVIDEFVI